MNLDLQNWWKELQDCQSCAQVVNKTEFNPCVSVLQSLCVCFKVFTLVYPDWETRVEHEEHMETD